MSEQFTPEAAMLWWAVSKEKQLRLRQGFCRKCPTSVEAVKYTAKLEHGDIVFESWCAVCGGKVARVVETLESDVRRN